MKRTIFIIIVISVVVAISVILSGMFDNAGLDIKPSDKDNLIVVASPIKDSEVSSPLSVAGRARGSWFFEGSFPILIQDSYGNIVAESHATAQGTWTSKDFVKFVGNLQFSNYIKGSKASLILKRDNPSGLTENDDSIVIPIILK